MKRDEPFDPSIKSKKFPEGLIFRIANRQDCDSINILTYERNPFQSMKEIEDGTTREIERMESGASYKLYVAELNKEIIGFCRFANSDGLPASKKIYSGPEGWYGLGILVSPKYRRQNIAKFLTLKRNEVLKNLGVKEFYSVVDAKNLTSLKMHKEFGYIEIARAPGFLHIGFNDGVGCLLKLEF